MIAHRYLRSHLWSRKWLYLGGFLSLLVTSVTEVLAPKFAQWTLDALIAPHGSPVAAGMSVADARAKLGLLAAQFLIIGTIAMGGRAGWRHTLARATHEAGRMLRMDFWDKSSRMALRFFREGSLGDMMSRFSTDINQARMIFGFTLVLWIDCVLFSLFAFSAMLWISWRAGLACMLVLATVPFFIRKLARLEYAQHERAQGTLANFSDRMAQNLSAVRTQKASGVAEAWNDMLRSSARTYAHDRVRVLKTGLRIFPVTSSASLVCVLVVMVTSWFDLQAGRITPGGVFALFAYATLLQTPLFELADLVSEWQRGRASLDRVLNFQRQALTDEQAHEPGRAPLVRGGGAPDYEFGLELCGLEVRGSLERGRENGRQGFVMGPINLKARRGEWIGVGGRIGAGKSLLMATIAGIHPDASGSILVDGGGVTYLPQRPFVFSGTVRENLELGTACADGDLWRALEMVELGDEVRAMGVIEASDRGESFEGRGLDARLHEGGANLSGGQRQRLTIARALLRKAPVMLLDAPLSALDEATEAKILQNLRKELAGTTVIMVSHRQGVLDACDRVVELRVAEGCVRLFEREGVAGQGRPAGRKDLFEVMFDV